MEWVALQLVIAAAALFAYLHPDARKARRYEADLCARKPVSDEELFHRFFAAGEVAPDVPGRVRRVFAKHMGYPADRILPDDDLLFFWADLDMVALIGDLEDDFRIKITSEDAARTPCTIRAVTHLVGGKTALAARCN